MKRLTKLFLFSLCLTSSVYAQENSEKTAAERSAEIYASGYEKFRFGGYGEALASFMDYGINRFTGTSSGNKKVNRNSISIPRFVVAFDYKFNSQWVLGAEIEFEAGGTGSAYELENTENGEYETEVEKGGEVALEQFHITRLIHPAFNVRVGHLIVPVGLTNEHHEPINFFGTSRPEGESTIIPCTWHENGLEFFGTFGEKYSRFNYQFLIVAGLKIGGSFYYCNNVGANSDKPETFSAIGRSPLKIYTADFQYKNKYITARANMIYGDLANSEALSSAIRGQSNTSPYSRTVPVASNAVSYGGELGINLRSLFGSQSKFPVIYPFARYEYYNPQEKGEGKQVMDLRNKVNMWSVGANWYALPNLVVKADYKARKIGGGKYNSENEFSLGIAYIGWFFSR